MDALSPLLSLLLFLLPGIAPWSYFGAMLQLSKSRGACTDLHNLELLDMTTSNSTSSTHNPKSSPSCFWEEGDCHRFSPTSHHMLRPRGSSKPLSASSRRCSCAGHIRATPLVTSRQPEEWHLPIEGSGSAFSAHQSPTPPSSCHAGPQVSKVSPSSRARRLWHGLQQLLPEGLFLWGVHVLLGAELSGTHISNLLLSQLMCPMRLIQDISEDK